MPWIKNIFREVFGLFVDDGSFALAVLVWIGLVWFLWQRLHWAIPGGIVLFVGLGCVLVESVLRFSKRTTTNSTQD